MVTTTINSASQDPWTLTINAQIHATLSLMHTTPGVTPAQRSQARSLASDIRSLVARSTGLNLDAFRAVSRGIHGVRRAVNARPGYLPQAESSRVWFDREGISRRERLDAKKEERHFQRRRRVADRIEQCCAGIEKIRAAAAKAAELFLDAARRVLQLVGAFPFPKLVAMAADLVIRALDAVRRVVSDHNDAVEQCLDEIAKNIDDAAEEQPAAPVDYKCNCSCADGASKPKRKPGGVGIAPASPPTATAPTTLAQPAPAQQPPASVTAPASAGTAATTPAAAAPPTTPVASAVTPATGPSSAASMTAPLLDGAKVVDRPANSPQRPGTASTSRLCRTIEKPQVEPSSTSAQARLQPQQQEPKVAFNYAIPDAQNASVETVTCTVAETMTPPPTGGESAPARLIGTPLGRLGAVAVLGGVGFLAYSLHEAAQTHCACECCTAKGGADPEPQPAPAPAPEPAPAPAPTSEDKPCTNVTPPPPELAKVPEPVPPKEKSAMMHTVPAAQSSGTGGSSNTSPGSTSIGPSGPQPAAPKPGAAWGSKKLGDW